jgi:hypothetical protein
LISQCKIICNVYVKPVLTFSSEIWINGTKTGVMAMNCLRSTERETRREKLGMIFLQKFESIIYLTELEGH